MVPSTPLVAVDVIIQVQEYIVLIKRQNPPHGWALPGGFVENGETVESAVRREAREETGLELDDLQQYHVYSEPDRDPRGHTISIVFTAHSCGIPRAASDASQTGLYLRTSLPERLAFDHRQILEDHFNGRYR